MKRRSIILAVLVVLVPALAGLMVLSAATTPASQAAAIPAAIVNLDGAGASTADGQALPAGRMLVGRLTGPEDSMTARSSTGATTQRLDYSVVSQDTAEQGLKDGTYDVVITIPQGFSQSIVDTLAGQATPATVTVSTAGSVSQAVGQPARRSSRRPPIRWAPP